MKCMHCISNAIRIVPYRIKAVKPGYVLGCLPRWTVCAALPPFVWLSVLITPQEAQTAVYEVRVKNFEFLQPFDTVFVGDTIRWIWEEGIHTTTSNGIPPGAMPWNALLDQHHPVFEYVIWVVGRYEYISLTAAPLMGSSFVVAQPTSLSIEPSGPIQLCYELGSSLIGIEVAAPTHATVWLYSSDGRLPLLLLQGHVAAGKTTLTIPSRRRYSGWHVIVLHTPYGRHYRPILLY